MTFSRSELPLRILKRKPVQLKLHEKSVGFLLLQGKGTVVDRVSKIEQIFV